MRGCAAGFSVGLSSLEEGGVAPAPARRWLKPDEPGVGVEGGAPGS